MQGDYIDAEAQLEEDHPQRIAAAVRAASRPLVPGDYLEVFAVRFCNFGGSTVVSVRRPVYDIVSGLQVGWQCWEVPLLCYSFAPLRRVEITRVLPDTEEDTPSR